MSDPQDALDQIKERMKLGGYRTVSLSGDPDADGLLDVLRRDSQADVPRLVAAIEAVLKMHRQVPLYGHEDDCTNTDEEHREEHFQSDDASGEFYCHELIEGWTCAECADVQDVASLAGPPEWPCPTVRALTAKLSGEDDEQ